jgi:NADH-quinone oxidoreductase subunit K
MLTVFAIVIAGAESAVGLALIVAIFRHNKSVHMNDLESLRG